jgi:hypothetical protein
MALLQRRYTPFEKVSQRIELENHRKTNAGDTAYFGFSKEDAMVGRLARQKSISTGEDRKRKPKDV